MLVIVSPRHIVLESVLCHFLTLDNSLVDGVVQELTFAQVKLPSLVANLHLELEHLIKGHV